MVRTAMGDESCPKLDGIYSSGDEDPGTLVVGQTACTTLTVTESRQGAVVLGAVTMGLARPLRFEMKSSMQILGADGQTGARQTLTLGKFTETGAELQVLAITAGHQTSRHVVRFFKVGDRLREEAVAYDGLDRPTSRSVTWEPMVEQKRAR
jgi:hypothetical protein